MIFLKMFHSGGVDEVELHRGEAPAILKPGVGQYTVAPGEDPPKPGEWVTFNSNGKLVRAVAGVDEKAFPLPPDARLSEDGSHIFWDL